MSALELHKPYKDPPLKSLLIPLSIIKEVNDVTEDTVTMELTPSKIEGLVIWLPETVQGEHVPESTVKPGIEELVENVKISGVIPPIEPALATKNFNELTGAENVYVTVPTAPELPLHGAVIAGNVNPQRVEAENVTKDAEPETETE